MDLRLVPVDPLEPEKGYMQSRWMTQTEMLLTQGFPIFPCVPGVAPGQSTSFNIDRPDDMGPRRMGMAQL